MYVQCWIISSSLCSAHHVLVRQEEWSHLSLEAFILPQQGYNSALTIPHSHRPIHHIVVTAHQNRFPHQTTPPSDNTVHHHLVMTCDGVQELGFRVVIRQQSYQYFVMSINPSLGYDISFNSPAVLAWCWLALIRPILFFTDKALFMYKSTHLLV